jgi:hypothetical protein
MPKTLSAETPTRTIKMAPHRPGSSAAHTMKPQLLTQLPRPQVDPLRLDQLHHAEDQDHPAEQGEDQVLIDTEHDGAG